MRIYVTKDSRIAGSDWKAGTFLQAADKDAKKAIAEGAAVLPADAPKPKSKPKQSTKKK